MNKIKQYRERFLSRHAQVAVIDIKGNLVLSCNTLFNFEPLIGKSAFDSFPFLQGFAPTLLALLPDSTPFLLPAIDLENRICDLEFLRHDSPAGPEIIWTLHDMTREYSRLRQVLELKDASLVGSEITRQQNTLLQNYVARLEQANEDLDRFAYIVSHDLKTPLRGIRNLSTWIAEDLGENLPQEIKDHITLLQKQVLKMDSLIEGVLKYSRAARELLHLEPVMISELLEEIRKSLQGKNGIKVVVKGDMPILTTSRSMLEQVFSNLIHNAVLHHDKTEGEVVISCENLDGFTRFTVEDDGPGISPEYHQKIFEIFQTLGTNKNEENTGVGLAIVKKIIQEAGGAITLESDKGKGARFSFTWPKE
ncbi:MAG: GHKL domain-containing protein [Bacteroidia bacterium]|nr:GHKL domain-containing protein [Bacteroidia bacterium]